jgi:hypothetical protein
MDDAPGRLLQFAKVLLSRDFASLMYAIICSNLQMLAAVRYHGVTTDGLNMAARQRMTSIKARTGRVGQPVLDSQRGW